VTDSQESAAITVETLEGENVLDPVKILEIGGRIVGRKGRERLNDGE
jgi:hypothetical protein